MGRIFFPREEKSSLVGWETVKKILLHFSLGEEYSLMGEKNLPLLGNGEEILPLFSLALGEEYFYLGKKNLPLRGNREKIPSPFLPRGRIFFPGEEKSSLIWKQGRKSFPIPPQEKNILPQRRKIFPCWKTGKKIVPHFSLGEEYSSLGKKNLPLLVNGEENPSPFLLRGRIFFPREEKSSLVGKGGRKSFPIIPQGKNILTQRRKIFPYGGTGGKNPSLFS